VTASEPKKNICRSVELNQAQEVYSENGRSKKELKIGVVSFIVKALKGSNLASKALGLLMDRFKLFSRAQRAILDGAVVL
jgi:hypothetical protein